MSIFRHQSNTPSDRLPVHIRWMIRRDLPEVLDIEHNSAENPWGEEEFLRNLRQRNCIGMVAEAGDRVVGYMIYELHSGHLQVFKLAVHPDFRKRGVGTQLIDKLTGKLSSHRRTALKFAVNERELGAQLFLKKMGVKAFGTHREYFDNGDDAYLMRYDLAEPEPEVPPEPNSHIDPRRFESGGGRAR